MKTRIKKTVVYCLGLFLLLHLSVFTAGLDFSPEAF